MMGWSKSRARGNAKFFFLFSGSCLIPSTWDSCEMRQGCWSGNANGCTGTISIKPDCSHKSLFIILTPIAGQKHILFYSSLFIFFGFLPC